MIVRIEEKLNVSTDPKEAVRKMGHATKIDWCQTLILEANADIIDFGAQDRRRVNIA